MRSMDAWFAVWTYSELIFFDTGDVNAYLRYYLIVTL